MAAVRERRWVTLAVLCASLVLISLDNTILNVALPTLVRELHASDSELQWIVDAYVIVFACLLLTAGSLGDRFGRKGALVVGLVVFGLFSAAAAFVTSPAELVATRALRGVGAAFIMPATLSILTNVFTEPDERARAIGIWAGVAGLGVAVGPVLGGWLLQHFWWGSVFLLNVPVVVLTLVASLLWVPTSRDAAASPLDPIGATLSIVGLVVLLWAIIEAPAQGWGSLPTLAGFALAAALIVAFVIWEQRRPQPMLDMRYFRNPRFSAAAGAVTLAFLALHGTMFLLTQYLQAVRGSSALSAGAQMAPIAGVLLVAGPLSSTWVRRFGSKAVIAVGLALVGLGLGLLALLGPDSGYLLLLPSLLCLGLGIGATSAPATESVMGSLPRDKAGVGSGVNNTTRQVGGALGVAVLGSVMSSWYGAGMREALAGTDLPAATAAAAMKNIGSALQAAAALPSRGAAEALASAARGAFLDGMHVAVLVAAAVALLGVVVVVAFLPARALPLTSLEPEREEVAV